MELLERLIKTPGVPGREHRMRELILRETEGLFDETRVDPLGSLICLRKARPGSGKRPQAKSFGEPKRVMLAAHMDQIGFLVKHIDANGFLRVNPVGGFDTRNLFARLVTVCPDPRNSKLDIPGVMNPAGKPIHIADEADKNKVPQISEFAVDLGMPVKEVQKRVKIGDMVVIRATFDLVGRTAVGQAMDNRVACWVAIRALQALEKSGKGHDCDIYCSFTVQEEVGCRGAGTSSYSIEPDITLSLDTTLAVDTPGVPEDQRVSKQGDGVGLLVMDSSMISDLELLEDLEAVAKKYKIKAQRTILPRGGNDGYAIQLKRAGRRVATLVCPTRYIHTVTEMILLDDLHATRDLVAAYLAQVR